jgi:D-amino-acid dehydrogenase
MSVIPPAVPGIWRKLPGYLADPLGPLAIRPRRLPRAAPWLVRYLASGWTEARVRATARALRPLLEGAPARHAALARDAGHPELIESRGLWYVYPDRAAFEAEAMSWRIRRGLGIAWHEFEADELRSREPDLARRYRFGVLVPEGGHCRDPGAHVAALVALARAEGVVFRRARATGFSIARGRLQAVLTEQGEIAADRAVIAAGARSAALARAAGDAVPLESERGYHAVLLDAPAGPRTPLMPSDGKMSVIMTRAGLRVAGQVEIAGLEAAPDWRRAEVLREWMFTLFPSLPRDLPPERFRLWMGHRPSPPDGKPVIGPARGSADIVHAFGHGHVGLVAGPRTGEAVAALLLGASPTLPLAPFSAQRF